jgi:hypothetical protein
MLKPMISMLMLIPFWGFAQSDSTRTQLIFSGYAELYYAYDFSQPEDHLRPSFLYSHNRHNEFNLNLGYLKGDYQAGRVRANLALATGTYMLANYAAEPDVLKNILEANAGIKLSKTENLWIEAGIFSSHIGFESAISKNCHSLTRSILAENSPYYESGAKVTYITDNHHWLFSGLMLNGWQHIQRPDGNNTPAFGTQVTFTPSQNLTLNYSTFIGNDKPDDAKQMRYYHNFYGQWFVSNSFHITAGFDLGFEQTSPESNNYNTWYSPVLIFKYFIDDQWSLTGRAEFYNDAQEVIVQTGTANGFQTSGYSLGIDFQVLENAAWRIEGRYFNSKDDIFLKDKEALDNNLCLTTSLAVSF